MKETIVRLIKLKAASLRILKKSTSLQPDSSRKKERGIKSTKLEMNKEKIQQTMQKYEGL